MPDKGEMGGQCNRTACAETATTRHLQMNHIASGVWYCAGCAGAINRECEIMGTAPCFEPVRHQWGNFVALSWESCKFCGVVRRRDDKNGPCKGRVTVSTR